MALDMQGILREVLTNAIQGGGQGSLRDVLTNAIQGDGQGSDGPTGGGQSGNGASESSSSNGGMSGIKGLAAGAGAAALAPALVKGAGKLAKGLGVDSLQDLMQSPGDLLQGATSKVGDRVKDTVKGEVDEAGGPGGMLKDAAKSALPFGGGDGGGGKGGTPGVGKGRRMPVQQSMDIGLPIETVYNQFTQFEEWPNFMHRVVRATQEDECTVSFEAKIWTRTREFTADIETQRPNERIKWSVSQGLTHTGVVTFHELGPKLTRVLVGFDVEPGGMIEKFARGARHIKRAARADLHRFKAFIEMAEQETGAWRGVIEEGELVEEHDPSYDEQREYADIEELTQQQDSEDENQEDEDGEEEQEPPRAKRSQSRQRSGSGNRQKQSENGGEKRSQPSRRRGQASGRSRSSTSSSSGRRSSGGRSSRSQASKR